MTNLKCATEQDFNQFKTLLQLNETPTFESVIERITSKLFVSEIKKFERRKTNGQ